MQIISLQQEPYITNSTNTIIYQTRFEETNGRKKHKTDVIISNLARRAKIHYQKQA